MLIIELDGKPVNLWSSYTMEHPWLSFLQVNRDDILRNTKEAIELWRTIKEASNSQEDQSEEMRKKREFLDSKEGQEFVAGVHFVASLPHLPPAGRKWTHDLEEFSASGDPPRS